MKRPYLQALFALTLSIHVASAASSVIIQEDFQESDSLGIFNSVSVTSNFAWRWEENNFDGRFVSMSGFGADGASDDWLILNQPLDLGDYANPNVSFRYIARFGGPDMELLVSSDYDADVHTNPADATWTPLPFFTAGEESEPNPDSWNAQFSDAVDLSAYTSESVYLAFHYTSTGSESDQGRVWRVDDFVVADSDPEAILLLSALDELESWTTTDVVGSEEWGILLLGDREGLSVDGAFSPAENEDWLISPPLAVGAEEIPVVNFDYYTEASGAHVELLVSNDYDAATHPDPNSATWTSLPIDFSSVSAESWTSIPGNTFYGIAGDQVHIAFKYTSTGGDAAQGRLIGISNVCVFKATEAPPLTAAFSGIPVQPTTSETVQFDAQPQGGRRPYTYAWDFGDGTTADTASPTHQYVTAGLYTVTLTLTDALGGESVLARTDYINAVNAANVVLNTNFEGADEDVIPGPWQVYSVASDAEWRLDTEASRSGAIMTGFGSDEASEDWLISPKMSLVGSLIPVLTVDVFTRFDGPLLEVLVSADYTDGDPTGATWSSLNVDFSGLPEQEWTEVGGLSLAGLNGDYTLAFKYVSTGFGSSDGRTYGIDNVRVINETELPALSNLRFTGSATKVTTEDAVSFRPFITGGKHPYTYAWDFGDMTSSEGAPSHMFAAAGSYDVSLTVTDADGTERQSSLGESIEVIDISSVLFQQDFAGFDGDDPSTDWINVSVSSFAGWEIDTIGGQQGVFINGFGSDEGSDDWLISPIITIGEGESALLSFDLNRFFDGGTFEVLAANDYDPGSNDPSSATWVPINGDFTADDWSRPSDLAIPVSGDVRLAFHYTSTGTGPGDGQRIGIDQVQIIKATVPPVGDDFLNSDFEGAVDDPISAPWTTVSVSGDSIWDIQEWNGRNGAFMNGFGADAASEDWLISPAMDLSGDEIPLLAFSHFVRFGGPQVQVLVSTDFESDPNAATWTDLQLDFAPLPEREWVDFADINLAAFDGAKTHVAFKYLSNGSEGGDGRLAGVDSVVVSKSDTAPALVVIGQFAEGGNVGDGLSFSASASGGSLPYTFAWDFGDGSMGEGAEVSHSYTAAGPYTVIVTAMDGANGMMSQSGEVTILAAGDTLLTGVFEGDDDSPISDPWIAVSVASDRDWTVDTTGGSQGAVANGFGADAPSDDWLISPPFDLAFGAQTTLAFDYYQNFSGPELEVLIGGDFQAGTDPTTVHWSPITVDLSAVPNNEWSRQSSIDLSSFVGRQCRLAFRYTTVGTGGGEGKLIGLNNVRIGTIIPDMPAPETYTFEEWKAVNGHFKSGDPAGVSEADADGDGFTNGLEFRFDLNPRSGVGYANLPQITELEDGTLSVTYRRISDEAAWEVQLSDDLIAWSTAEEGQDIETTIQKDDGLGEVLETVRVDLKTANHYFRVVLP